MNFGAPPSDPGRRSTPPEPEEELPPLLDPYATAQGAARLPPERGFYPAQRAAPPEEARADGGLPWLAALAMALAHLFAGVRAT